jgi:hypothetical protein
MFGSYFGQIKILLQIPRMLKISKRTKYIQTRVLVCVYIYIYIYIYILFINKRVSIFKGTVVPLLHEMNMGPIAPHINALCTRLRREVSFMPRVLYFHRKSPLFLLKRRPLKPRIMSRSFGEKRNLFHIR